VIHNRNPITTKTLIDAIRARVALAARYPAERVYVVTDSSTSLYRDPPADRYASLSLLRAAPIEALISGSGEEQYCFEASFRLRQFQRLEVDIDGDEYQSLFGGNGLIADLNRVLQKAESGGLQLWACPDASGKPQIIEPMRIGPEGWEAPSRAADSPIAVCWSVWRARYLQKTTV
jgi:hypothetical protein